MTYAIHAATLHGVEALPVTVEVDLSAGIPGVTIVGMPDSAVLEARSRVRCALRSAGFEIPRMHVTVNLAPATLKKSGSDFDLAIACGILAASSQISPQGLDGCMFAGELGLDGSVCEARGSVAYEVLASQCGLTLVGQFSARRHLDTGVAPLRCSTLAQLKRGVTELQSVQTLVDDEASAPPAPHPLIDFSDVADQELAKSALVVAAAGHHGVLMMGPPGSGKTMLARRVPQILPPMGERERMDALLIHSVAGQPLGGLEAGERPFRAPHHSVSIGGLLGGGRPVKPGELSLAHGGVLFLDELPEFASNALQSLRQPLEDHEVRIVRVEGTYAFPCDFQLVAAANPCPCGFYGDKAKPCTCTPAEVSRYQGKVGGPLMDRIDLHVSVARPSSAKVIAGEEGMSSAQMREQVTGALEFRAWRDARRTSFGEVHTPLHDLTDEAGAWLESIAERQALGGRAIAKTVRVARTVADLERHEGIERMDVMQAMGLRLREGSA